MAPISGMLITMMCDPKSIHSTWVWRYSIGKSPVIVFVFLCLQGCNASRETNSIDDISGPPTLTMRKLVQNGRLEEAYALKDEVLKTRSNDPDTLRLIAKVAHANQNRSEAADFLRQACVCESYSNATNVKQAALGMIQAGRLIDAMDLLETAVGKHPDQHDNRRWLFDFCVGIEDQVRGREHARYLIRKRQFDIDLLLSISEIESRSLESQPLLEMSKLNPDDKRPLLGVAKQRFDKREFESATEMLKQIATNHPDFVPAQALSCLALSKTQDFDELRVRIASLPPTIQQEPSYWDAIGMLCLEEEQFAEAARCYWEATQRDALRLESWSQLHQAIERIDEFPADVGKDIIAVVGERHNLLRQFTRDRSRFIRAGKVSRELAYHVASSLEKLGRLWEAEAWASMSMGLPEDDSVPLGELRKSIIKQLDRDTPWQLANPPFELSVDLSSLPLPETIEKLVHVDS